MTRLERERWKVERRKKKRTGSLEKKLNRFHFCKNAYSLLPHFCNRYNDSPCINYMFKNQEVRVAIHLQKIYQLAKWNSTPKGGGRKEPAMSNKEDSLEKAAVILSVERTMIFDSINCLKISMHYVSLQKPFETECTQEACWMEHHRDTAGFLWVQDASLWSPGKPTVTRCPHRARCTAQEALLTEVHTEKNW